MSEAREDTAKKWVLVLTSAASFMVALDALVVTTALSTIRADLGASIETLEWIVNAYNLAFAVLLLTGAALGDRFGRRRIFAAGLALFVVASAACALSASAGALIAARAAQGIGAALVMPLAMALLGAAFPREQRGKALGILSGITGIALIAGPVAGGAIATGFDWRCIFRDRGKSRTRHGSRCRRADPRDRSRTCGRVGIDACGGRRLERASTRSVRYRHTSHCRIRGVRATRPCPDDPDAPVQLARLCRRQRRRFRALRLDVRRGVLPAPVPGRAGQ
jgi:hypothetical protein